MDIKNENHNFQLAYGNIKYVLGEQTNISDYGFDTSCITEKGTFM